MLQYAITDLPKYLVEDLYSDDDPVVDVRATQARDNAHGIVNGIMDIDSKLRSNLRAGNPIRSKAKNALARMQHSLEYHLQAAQIKVDKLALKRRLGNKTLAQPVDGKVGEGQITINSFFKASTPSLA